MAQPQLSVDDMIQQRDQAVKLVTQLDKALGRTGIRSSQRSLMRDRKAAELEIDIHLPKNYSDREHALTSPKIFLPRYFADLFTNPFTDTHDSIIDAVLDRARYGGKKAIAAPRGEGKTTLTTCVIIYALLAQLIRFPVIVAQTGPHAERIFNDIKYEFETNDLLFDDFPEICCPVRALEGAVQRGRMQRHQGRNTNIEWKASHLVFPTVTGHPHWRDYGKAAVIYYGLDSAIRGVKIKHRRPDFVLIDDPETRESAASPHQIAIREQIIESDIGGLKGQTGKIGMVMLCTIQNPYCIAARYTDRTVKHSWNGSRHSAIIAWPTNMALWDEYQHRRHEAMEAGDEYAWTATQFYIDNREAMDAGHKVANPARFENMLDKNGHPKEISALHACFNFICDYGMQTFMAESQNDPVEADRAETNGLTAHAVMNCTNGLKQGQVPDDAAIITAAIDIGKYGLHWAKVAWLPHAAGLIVDYGVQELHGIISPQTTGEALERAIFNALLEFRDHMLSDQHSPMLIGVDSGDYTHVIYEFVRQVGGTPFIAMKGEGGGRFRHGTPSEDRIVGTNWFASRQRAEQLWLYLFNTDEWKSWVHQRFLTPTMDDLKHIRPGTYSLYSPPPSDKRKHNSFAHHIVAEELREEFIAGKGLKRWWHKVNRNNHWLDVMTMNSVAANVAGVRLDLGDQTIVPMIQPVRTQPQASSTDSGKHLTPDGRPYLITERNP